MWMYHLDRVTLTFVIKSNIMITYFLCWCIWTFSGWTEYPTLYLELVLPQQTQNIGILFVHRHSNIVQMLYKCFVFAGSRLRTLKSLILYGTMYNDTFDVCVSVRWWSVCLRRHWSPVYYNTAFVMLSYADMWLFVTQDYVTMANDRYTVHEGCRTRAPRSTTLSGSKLLVCEIIEVSRNVSVSKLKSYTTFNNW